MENSYVICTKGAILNKSSKIRYLRRFIGKLNIYLRKWNVMTTKIVIVLTCFNRRSFTKNCIEKLGIKNDFYEVLFVVTDDLSTDGTKEMLQELKETYKINVIEGNGSLFWNGGMHKGLAFVLEAAKENVEESVSSKEFENTNDSVTQFIKTSDYVMLVNDDVDFETSAVSEMLHISDNENVVVGTVKSNNGTVSYGGVHFLSKYFVKYLIMDIDDNYKCDTFNANAVLIPMKIIKKAGNIDETYGHSLGDFDYGLRISKLGYNILKTNFYVGSCEDNDLKGTWRDTSLSITERLKKKESKKGLPFKDWWHFVYKNFGLLPAIYHSMTPYVRILLRK